MKKLSGKFVLRIPSQVHGALKKLAQEKDLSLNQMCEMVLSQHVRKQEQDKLKARLESFQKHLHRVWPGHIVGLVLFGSVVRGETYDTSDVDLLVVLEHKQVTRSLYKTWDNEIDDDLLPQVNPHFVVFPQTVKSVGSLWFEIMNEGVVIWEKENKVSSLLKKIKKNAEKSKIKKTHAHGHAYWIREGYA